MSDTIIQLKRVYEDPAGESSDGWRVFVDRLWPRGESKEKFHYDLWAKDLAPSDSLREWFHQDPGSRWDEFVSRYRAELAYNPAFAAFTAACSHHPIVTLLYGSRDTAHNNAVVIALALREAMAD